MFWIALSAWLVVPLAYFSALGIWRTVRPARRRDYAFRIMSNVVTLPLQPRKETDRC